MATKGLIKVRAIQITKELFFCPRDWLDSCRKRSPPSKAPSPKLRIQMTSEIKAIQRTFERDADRLLRRKFPALEHMLKRASSQNRKENRLPLQTTVRAFCGNQPARRASSSGTNMVISTGSSTCQTEMWTISPTTKGRVTGSTSDITTLLNSTAPTTYSTCP